MKLKFDIHYINNAYTNQWAKMSALRKSLNLWFEKCTKWEEYKTLACVYTQKHTLTPTHAETHAHYHAHPENNKWYIFKRKEGQG